jgi:molybdopterin-guanine dinucleotide biosynthesis protein A
MHSGININGLVLAGGKSSRLGRDKSAVDWHGAEQQYYLADLLLLLAKRCLYPREKINKMRWRPIIRY